MSKEKIILIGGGGHCRSVIDVIETEERFDIAGIIDKKELIGQSVLSYPIIGSDDDLGIIMAEYTNFLITVGQIKSSAIRVGLYESIKLKGGKFPVIVSPLAYISRHATVGEGTVIMHRAILNTNARIGKNCIINTGAVIEHDALIGNHCHISTGAYVNGECVVGNHTFVGSHATIAQCIKVADNNVIAAGSVLIQHAGHGGLYAGNPAQLKRNSE